MILHGWALFLLLCRMAAACHGHIIMVHNEKIRNKISNTLMTESIDAKFLRMRIDETKFQIEKEAKCKSKSVMTMTMMTNLLAMIGQQSWRDILLTALLASSILYFLVFKNSDDVFSSTNETHVSSEEERRRRRDHLAKIAEERAKRIAAATAADAAAVSNKDKREVAARVFNSSRQHIASTETRAEAEATTLREETSTTKAASTQIKKKLPIQNNEEQGLNNNGALTAPNEAKKIMMKTQKGKDEHPKNKENVAKVEKSYLGESNETNNPSKRQVGSNNETDDKTNMNVDVSSSSEKKLASIPTTLNTEAVQENDQESITIYLLKSSSSRIEVTIAKNATPSQLRQVVSESTDIPLTGLRLIFRGRMIVEKNTGNVVDEFGIEDGSALHVVGKPHTSTPASSPTAPASHQQQQPQTSTSQQEMIRLIHQGLQINPDNFFHNAAAEGYYELIEAAIHDGSFNTHLNRADENGWTPLHEAIRGGHQRVVTILLDEGGLDIHAITNQGSGFSPLSLSIHSHSFDHPLSRMIRGRGGREVWPEAFGQDPDEDEDEEESWSSSS